VGVETEHRLFALDAESVHILHADSTVRQCSQAACTARLLALLFGPDTIGTPMLFGIPNEVQRALAASVPLPSRLDGAIRPAPK